MPQVSYDKYFWGTEFTSSAGFDVLIKHMEEGKMTCKVIENYFKLRSKAEEDYSKALFKASKPGQDPTENGMLITVWNCLKKETEKMASVHQDCAFQFQDLSNKVLEFYKRQRSDRKKKEESVSSLAREKLSSYKKTLEVKKNYESKSQDAELSENLLKKAKLNDNSYATKEWDKIVSKSTKAIQDATKSDANYRENVTKLDEIRLIWEKEMKEYSLLCESQDEERMKFLRSEMWNGVNITSVHCLLDDESCESVRNVLENINIYSDMQEFVMKNQTGMEKPEKIIYEKYQSKFSSSSSVEYYSNNNNNNNNNINNNNNSPNDSSNNTSSTNSLKTGMLVSKNINLGSTGSYNINKKKS